MAVALLPRASAAEKERLVDEFVRLCEIESPSLSERAMADAVAAELRALGLEVEEDGSGAETGSSAGNLLARIGGPEGARTILLCAHLDTVPLDAPVVVSRSEEGVIENRNEAILGADNKAAVAVILAVARRLVAEGSPVGRRAAVHNLRGARAARRQGVRPLAPGSRHRLRVRPRVADRRADPGRADLLQRRGPLPRQGRPRRALPREGAQRDRGRGGGCRGAALREARPRHDRRTSAGSRAAAHRTWWPSAAP